MAHHASKAFFVAAYAAHYLLRMITNHLVGPGGIGDQLTAHRRAIDPALSQLLFHKTSDDKDMAIAMPIDVRATSPASMSRVKASSYVPNPTKV